MLHNSMRRQEFLIAIYDDEPHCTAKSSHTRYSLPLPFPIPCHENISHATGHTLLALAYLCRGSYHAYCECRVSHSRSGYQPPPQPHAAKSDVLYKGRDASADQLTRAMVMGYQYNKIKQCLLLRYARL